MRRPLILRPEPGASATAERARSLGLDPLTCPLFTLEPLAWTPPDPNRYDALLLTSANALRHGGSALEALHRLPVFAVGEATAAAASAAGFDVARTGTGGVGVLLAGVPEQRRLLHLTGEHHARAWSAHPIDAIPVYRSTAIADPLLPDPANMVALVHSPRAGARFAQLVAARSNTVIAAISEVAASACGSGWESVAWADPPGDRALLELAARLCQSPP